MASAPLGMARVAPTGQSLLACVADRGSAAHPWPRDAELLHGEHSARSLADLIYYLCTLHGRYPGVIDHASLRAVDAASRGWFAETTYAFAGERAYLARLAVAAGPVPSTPGGAGSDSVVLSQRHALDMLAQSERTGCALGASLALVLDWSHVRAVLDVAARRFGIEPPPYAVARVEPLADLADSYAENPGVQRALLFGAEQILHQHHGLWDLLEARHQARAAG